MNQIKTLCYDMLVDIIDIAEKKPSLVKPQAVREESKSSSSSINQF
jgi:hypothetical protein